MNDLGTQITSKTKRERATRRRRQPGMLRSAVVWVILTLLALPVASDAKAAKLAGTLSTCQTAVQVNEGAFGLGTGADSSYSAEEGFEVLVFNNQLYLGMEADNSMGARIWRTRSGITVPASQADWEEVAADANGKPFGVENVTQNDHIDSLAEFNGYIYASTANGGSSTFGNRIFRSPNGNPSNWQDAIAAYGAGFGDIYNTNFKDMQVFDGWLCGGTQNWVTGAQVWCTGNGTTWTQKNIGGFGNPYYNNRTVEVWSGYVFEGALYFGVQNLGASRSDVNDDVGKLYRTTSLNGTPVWEEVYSGPAGSYRVDLLGELNGDLYISIRSSQGIVILRSPNGAVGSWQQVNNAGMDGKVSNSGSVVDNAATHDGGLYVAVSNTSTGFELWRTAGTEQAGGLVDWERVGSSGLGDVKNIYSQLIEYNDYLYAWTSNYVRGQQVLRFSCLAGAAVETPTATNTPLPTATNTPLPTATNTPEPTATNTPLPTATNTPLPTATNTPEPTATNTPEPTATETPLPTATHTSEPTATNTPESTVASTPEPTATDTPEPTATNTPLPTATDTPQPTPTDTPEPTATNTPEPTATITPLPTATNTPLPTATNTPLPTATNTPLPTATHTPEPTATNTPLLTATDTPEPTATNTPEPTLTDTPEPTATNTPLPTATDTPQPTATNTPEPTLTDTPEPTVTNTSEPTPTNTTEPTATDTPEPTVTNTPQPTPTNIPEPTATDTAEPTPIDTPEPTTTHTPFPTATDSPPPAATATPEPTSTMTPDPTATGAPEPTMQPTEDPVSSETPLPTTTGTPIPTATATPEPTNTPLPTATTPAEATTTPLPSTTPTPTPTATLPPYCLNNTGDCAHQGPPVQSQYYFPMIIFGAP